MTLLHFIYHISDLPALAREGRQKTSKWATHHGEGAATHASFGRHQQKLQDLSPRATGLGSSHPCSPGPCAYLQAGLQLLMTMSRSDLHRFGAGDETCPTYPPNPSKIWEWRLSRERTREQSPKWPPKLSLLQATPPRALKWEKILSPTVLRWSKISKECLPLQCLSYNTHWKH